MKIIKNILTKFRWQNNRILTFSVHLLLWIASVTLFYVLLSIFVDMPAESELRNTNNKLNSEYNKMSERYEELTEVMDNVVARDENVFRKLFESNPYDLTIDDDEERIALHESLMDLDNDELLSELNNKLQSAENDKDALTRSYEDMMYAHETTLLSIDCIPAIQPENNRQLTLLAAGKKPLINPFHRTMREHHGVD